MGEMAAMGEIHRQNLVAWFEHREIDRHVGLRAAVRLNVHMVAAEQSLGAIDRQLLGNIDIFAAAIPTFPRLAFGVFVRQTVPCASITARLVKFSEAISSMFSRCRFSSA